MFSSPRGRRRREPQPKLDSILAISPDGTIAKANLQARRFIGDNDTVEGEQLGAVLAQLMMALDGEEHRVTISVPVDDGKYQTIRLVLSEQTIPHHLFSQMPGEAPEDLSVSREVASGPVNVADFVAHELRNNIAIMLGLSQLLDTNFDAMKAGDRTSALKGIESEGEHALVILDGLLKLVESRRQPEVARGRVPLHSVLRRVIADHKRRHPSRKFEVEGDAPVFATGNSTWIQLAIANLVSNAEKVTPGDQPIEVSVRQEGETAVIVILDQGQALTPVLYQKLWDIYSKGVPQGVEISGSGIGLSLCKELVVAMGGTVYAGPRSSRGSGFALSFRSLSEPSPSVMLPP